MCGMTAVVLAVVPLATESECFCEPLDLDPTDEIKWAVRTSTVFSTSDGSEAWSERHIASGSYTWQDGSFLKFLSFFMVR